MNDSSQRKRGRGGEESMSDPASEGRPGVKRRTTVLTTHFEHAGLDWAGLKDPED